MKTITLNVGIEKNEKGEKLYYAEYDLLVLAISEPPKNGLGLAENHKRMRLLDAIQDAAYTSMNDRSLESLNESLTDLKQVINLEDADFVKIQALIRTCSWPRPMRAISELATKFGIDVSTLN